MLLLFPLFLSLLPITHGQNITAFLTLRIDAPLLVAETGHLMSRITRLDPRLDQFTSDLDKLHVTIDLYHVDESNLENATEAMRQLREELCRLPTKRLAFNGTDLFDSQVLFGNLTQSSWDLMRDIQRLAKETFDRQGIPSLNQYDYHPHMTIVELPGDSPKDLRDELTVFKGHRLVGRQQFKKIYLCAMGGKRQGFYKIIDQQFIGQCNTNI